MSKIRLQRISLRNFKGIGSQSFEFEANETFIHGDNGTGKTSLFDAFIWTLFGKDHLGRSDYRLKTHDKTGRTIPKLDCEVEAVLYIDEKLLTLKRVYKENWVKPKTEPEEVFKNNTTDYFINDVGVSAKEYSEKVTSVCDEVLFRTITNPAYFPNLKEEVQKELLFKMIEDVTDKTIAAGNADFQQLLLDVSGVSYENYRKELLSKKSKIKDEIRGIPDRIDELKRSKPKVKNWSEIEGKISVLQDELSLIDRQLSDSASQSEEQGRERMKIQGRINELEMANQQLGFSETTKKNERISKIRMQISEIENSSSDVERKERNRLEKLQELTTEKNLKLSERETLLNEWRAISGEQLVFPEGIFDCPTCKRPLEIHDIDSKQKELTENFSATKVKKLETNKTKGIAIAERIKEIDKEIELNSEPIKPVMFAGTTKATFLDQIAEIEREESKVSLLPEHISNTKEIRTLREQLEVSAPTNTNEGLKVRKAEAQSEIDQLKTQLQSKVYIENTETRIKELESNFKIQNQALAELEKKEFILKQFEFEKNTQYENKINELFEFTKFKLFHQQVDGQIIPDCEATANGVPYGTQNNAMQINIGLDIIRTISKFNNMFAPIFIDNREGIVRIPEMGTQIINLVVEKDVNKLTIK